MKLSITRQYFTYENISGTNPVEIIDNETMSEHNTEEYELQNQSRVFQQLEKISYKNLFIEKQRDIFKGTVNVISNVTFDARMTRSDLQRYP